jgi:hypothetical protein
MWGLLAAQFDSIPMVTLEFKNLRFSNRIANLIAIFLVARLETCRSCDVRFDVVGKF